MNDCQILYHAVTFNIYISLHYGKKESINSNLWWLTMGDEIKELNEFERKKIDR